MCYSCHGPDNLPESLEEEELNAHMADVRYREHGDGDSECIRRVDLGTGDYELRCVDCGERVDSTDHSCYE